LRTRRREDVSHTATAPPAVAISKRSPSVVWGGERASAGRRRGRCVWVHPETEKRECVWLAGRARVCRNSAGRHQFVRGS
jgi:hypothetical protein